MSQRFSTCVGRVALLLVPVLCQTSCIILPAPSLPETIESTIDRQQLQSIESSQSGKDQIVELFGSPQWVSKDDSQWKYETRRYYPPGWDICIGGLYGSACDPLYRSLKVEILEINFDNSGTVTDWATRKLNFEKCIESGECSFIARRSRTYGLPHSEAWLVELSHLDLVERDGLLYAAGATSPFTGVRSSYYADGTKASEYQFEMGLRHGTCVLWYDDGSIYKTMNYEVGSLMGERVLPREHKK